MNLRTAEGVGPYGSGECADSSAKTIPCGGYLQIVRLGEMWDYERKNDTVWKTLDEQSVGTSRKMNILSILQTNVDAMWKVRYNLNGRMAFCFVCEKF